METICNPINEPVYPVPDSQLQTPSLQSPTTPLETFLYKFDERRGQITAKAAASLLSLLPMSMSPPPVVFRRMALPGLLFL